MTPPEKWIITSWYNTRDEERRLMKEHSGNTLGIRVLICCDNESCLEVVQETPGDGPKRIRREQCGGLSQESELQALAQTLEDSQ